MSGTTHAHRPRGMYDRVIRELDRRGDWVGAADLARDLHISNTYCRDLLNDAVRAGFAEKDTPRGRYWKIVRVKTPGYGRDVLFHLSYAQALQVIRACYDQEIALTDAPFTNGSQGRLRALHNGRVRMEQALPRLGGRSS